MHSDLTRILDEMANIDPYPGGFDITIEGDLMELRSAFVQLRDLTIAALRAQGGE